VNLGGSRIGLIFLRRWTVLKLGSLISNLEMQVETREIFLRRMLKAVSVGLNQFQEAILTF